MTPKPVPAICSFASRDGATFFSHANLNVLNSGFPTTQ
jgi:hypothetical protein